MCARCWKQAEYSADTVSAFKKFIVYHGRQTINPNSVIQRDVKCSGREVRGRQSKQGLPGVASHQPCKCHGGKVYFILPSVLEVNLLSIGFTFPCRGTSVKVVLLASLSWACLAQPFASLCFWDEACLL